MCDTVVVVHSDRVLFAKNSDRDPNEAQVLEWHPPREHPDGSRVACTWIDIPQAEHTHGVLLSRPFWMWGAEMGANDQGVVIGNEAVFTDQPYEETGLLGMDLLRLALERASTAEEAVDVVTDLLETHGQGGGCGHEDRSFTYHNSFLIADPNGAYVLETAGRQWAVEHVTAGVRSISNGLTIPGFADAHSDWLNTTFSACRTRRALTERRGASAVEPSDLMAVLRDHDGPAPSYSPVTGAMAAPCMHAGGIAAASQTTGSWVSELAPDGSRHWATGTAAPCTSLFVPMRVAEPLDLGPAPDDRYDPATLWWRHERLHRRALRDPQRLLPRFAARRDAVEHRWIEADVDPESAADEAEALRRDWIADLEALDVDDRRPWYVRRYWRIRDRRAGMIRLDEPTAGATV